MRRAFIRDVWRRPTARRTEAAARRVAEPLQVPPCPTSTTATSTTSTSATSTSTTSSPHLLLLLLPLQRQRVVDSSTSRRRSAPHWFSRWASRAPPPRRVEQVSFTHVINPFYAGDDVEHKRAQHSTGTPPPPRARSRSRSRSCS